MLLWGCEIQRAFAAGLTLAKKQAYLAGIVSTRSISAIFFCLYESAP
jgi:hypothetical protein